MWEFYLQLQDILKRVVVSSQSLYDLSLETVHGLHAGTSHFYNGKATNDRLDGRLQLLVAQERRPVPWFRAYLKGDIARAADLAMV